MRHLNESFDNALHKSEKELTSSLNNSETMFYQLQPFLIERGENIEHEVKKKLDEIEEIISQLENSTPSSEEQKAFKNTFTQKKSELSKVLIDNLFKPPSS